MKEEKKILTNRTLVGWVRKILGKEKYEPDAVPDAAAKMVESFIERAASEEEITEESVKGLIEELTEEGFTGVAEDENGVAEDENKEGSCCSYAMKRNIVASLQEIRKFAEEHDLAATMVKALLTLLAEMALNALKGKVSGTVLAILLNALNYDRARAEAYKEGEIAGRNAKIITQYFPHTEDGLPDLPGNGGISEEKTDIFSIARDA